MTERTLYFKYEDVAPCHFCFETRGEDLDDIAEDAAREIWERHVDPTAFEDGECFEITLYDENKEFMARAEIRVNFADPEFTPSILEKRKTETHQGTPRNPD